MAASSLLKQRVCSSSSLCLGDSNRGLCSSSQPAALTLNLQWRGSRELQYQLGQKHRRYRALGVVMDGRTANAKPATNEGTNQEPLLRSSFAEGKESSAAEAAADEQLDVEEGEGVKDEVDGESYEEEVVIVQKPVQRRGTRDRDAYQTSIRHEVPPVSAGPNYPGSPLFWVGVGVALAVGGSFIAGRLKQRVLSMAMQAAMKGVMGGNGPQPGAPSGMPAGFPGMGPFPGMPPMPPPPTPQAKGPFTETTATPVPTVERPPEVKVAQPAAGRAKPEDEPAKRKRASFRDVKEEELKEEEQRIRDEPKRENFQEAEVVGEGTSTSGGAAFGTDASGGLTVEALEKMMEDPMVQQMIYPHLPEEMRNPQTFKWMMQNPMYKQQLQEMLSTMGGPGGNEELLKSLNMNSPEVKEQFDKIGMTPEEVISKILSTPDVAMAFQKPKVQAAIMDVTNNPMNILKYQSDPEVMDVFNKIQTMFPGMS